MYNERAREVADIGLFHGRCMKHIYFIPFFALLFLIEICFAQSKETVKVGALVSLSGDYALLGAEIRKGIELALEERIAHGKNVKIIFEDIQTINQKAAVSAAKKLIHVDKIDIGIGMVADDAEALGPIFTAQKVPLLILWDSTERLLESGPYVFSNGFSVEKAGELGARFASKKLKVERAAIVGHTAAWSQTISEAFAERFKETGGDVVAREEVSPDTVDFKSIILKLRAKNPDVIYFPLEVNPSLFLKQARGSGLSIPLVTGDAMLIPGEVEAAGDSAEGVFYSAVYTDNEEELQKLYDAKYGKSSEDPVSLAFGYDGMKVVFRAIDISVLESVSIRDALLKVLGPDRSANRLVQMFTIENGQPMMVKGTW